MEKKNINKILIVVVAAIWGAIFYNYFFNKSNKSIVIANTFSKNSFTNKVVELEKVNLKSVKRDPFLGTIVNRTVLPKKNTNKKISYKRRDRINDNHLVWPQIQYLGLIKKGNKETVCLLKMNNQFVKLKEKSRSKTYNVFIHKIYKDSVIIKQGKVSKTIKK